MSKIALCLTEKTLEENLKQINRYKGKIHLAELRVDCLSFFEINLSWLDSLKEFVVQSEIKLILTLRRKKDGGYCTQSEETRLESLEKMIPLGFSYVDLEDDLNPSPVVERVLLAAHKNHVRIIRSLHDFSGIPKNLVQRMEKNGKDGALPKAAVTLNHSRDIITFMNVVNKLKGQEKILLAMGERGFFSRILTEKIGSFLTFTSPKGSLKAASGQIDPDTLRDVYRYGQQKKDWPLYGIIGNPVIQSRSPELHNNWLNKKDLKGVYVPFLLDDLDDFAHLESLMGFQGLSVTIPFKEKIIPFITESSSRVKSMGACNTYYKKDKKVLGENSDALGFLYPLLDALGKDRSSLNALNGYKCTLVGAGGASRGVLSALINRGAEVLVLNRTLNKAEQLVKEFGGRAANLSAKSLSLIESYSSIIVQATSMGMAPLEHIDPLFFYEFKGDEFVYDIIYKPAKTVMMLRAEKAGCTVLGGWKMLREQGKVQFELFTGESVPED